MSFTPEKLLIERLKLTEEQAFHTGKMPFDEDIRPPCPPVQPPSTPTEGMQRPVILEADRLSPDQDARNTDPSIPPIGYSPFMACPDDGLAKIFEYFTLPERAKMSQTCSRFHNVMMDKKYGAIKGLTVINLFQKKVWDFSVKDNSTHRMTMFKMGSSAQVRSMLRHVKKVDCLKIWYEDKEFVDAVLAVFDDESLTIKSIDIFPYDSKMVLKKVAEIFPKIVTITMRPHGQNFFWKGLRIGSMPEFSNLTTLMLDSFEVLPPFAFPKSLKSLDFSHRDLICPHFFTAIDGLDLVSLSLGHLKLGKQNQMQMLITAISKMKRLEILSFKFCHLDVPVMLLQDVKLRLRHLHFDLCYDVSLAVFEMLVSMSQKTLKSVSVNALFEDDPQFHNTLIMTPFLRRLGASLSLSIMQKDNRCTAMMASLREGDINNRRQRERKALPEIPDELRDVLSRFEASYVVNDTFIRDLFSKLCPHLQECKFVSCKAHSDAIMELISVNCPNLRTLSVISCDQATEDGLLAFAQNILLRRTSAPLQIMFKNNCSFIRVYGELFLQEDSRDYTIHYNTKTFPGNGGIYSAGESLYIKHNKGNRTITIKNHSPTDSSLLFGLVIDLEAEMQLVNPHALKKVKETRDSPSPANYGHENGVD